MIELTLSNTDPKQRTLLERLQNMSLSFTVTTHQETTDPLLKDGKNEYQGFDEIHFYLEELADFMEKWYECTCDKYD